MFHEGTNVVYSDILSFDGVSHAFATRHGGVSVIPQVASMNVAVRLGDSPENVRENVARLAAYAGLSDVPVVYSRQIHSTKVLTVSPEDALCDPEEREFDGYVTDQRGIALLVRSADCLPILFCGVKEDSSPVIGAAHAGWRGTVSNIVSVVLDRMVSLGAVKDTIKVAIGPSIGECCFEVKEDFILSVTGIAGTDFAGRHIRKRDGRYFASLAGMNTEYLLSWGITPERIDISPECTAHMPDKYHSHRATGGMRGTGGGIIGII